MPPAIRRRVPSSDEWAAVPGERRSSVRTEEPIAAHRQSRHRPLRRPFELLTDGQWPPVVTPEGDLEHIRRGMNEEDIGRVEPPLIRFFHEAAAG